MDAGFRVVEVDFGDFLAIFFLGNSLRNVWYEGISYTCPLSGKGKELSIIFAFEFFLIGFRFCSGRQGVNIFETSELKIITAHIHKQSILFTLLFQACSLGE